MKENKFSCQQRMSFSSIDLIFDGLSVTDLHKEIIPGKIPSGNYTEYRITEILYTREGRYLFFFFF